MILFKNVKLNMDKLKNDYDLMGYYTLITSETDMDDMKIISTYKNLTEIEDQFRIMKSTLNTHPIFLQTEEHIKAPLTICTLALIILRMIQRQIKKKHPELVDENSTFQDGIPAERIQNALNKCYSYY